MTGAQVLAVQRRRADGLGDGGSVDLDGRCHGRRDGGRVGGLEEEDHSGTEVVQSREVNGGFIEMICRQL